MPFFPFLIIGAVAAVVAAIRGSRRRANAAWASAAQELGITLKPTTGLSSLAGQYSMSGSVQGLKLKIDTRTTNDRTYTRYRVRYPSLDLGLQAKRQHALTRFGTLLGFQDIEVGDPVFDEAIILKGDYPPKINAFLTPDRRLAITGLIEAYRGATISDTQIEYHQPKLASDAGEIVSVMQRLISVAQALRGVDTVARAAAEKRLAGDMAEALEMLEQASETGDPFIDFTRRQQLGEIRLARGDRAGAEEAFQSLKQRAPADPEIEGWTRPTEQPAPSASAEMSEDAEAVAEHLFHQDNYSFDTMELFEAEYEGRAVEWSGELKRLRRFDHDRDFGEGPGVKAVMRIAVLGSDLYSGREVDAIVRLPEHTADTLEIGHRYGFRGVLSRCDPAMRNLFIADATLS